jgi:peptidoglycan-associated lipoprotein
MKSRAALSRPWWRSPVAPCLCIAVAVAIAVPFAGCSHEQPPPPSRPPATAAARPSPVVHASAPEAPPAAPAAEAFDAGKKDKEEVFFDFDSALLRDEARPVLQKVATLAQQRAAAVRIEGNCDEVGTTEYNLALGEHRARQAKDYLVKLGVPPSKIDTVSYGAERPKADGHDEGARAQNRRDDLILR